MISVIIDAYAMNPIICCNIVSAKKRRQPPRKNTLRASLVASSGAHSFASHAASARKHSKLGKVRRGMPKITTQERKKSIEKWSRGSHFCIKWPSMRRKNTLQDRFVKLGSAEVVQGVQYTDASSASTILTLRKRKEIINVDVRRQSKQKIVQ